MSSERLRAASEKKKEDYTFWCQIDEKPGIMLRTPLLHDGGVFSTRD